MKPKKKTTRPAAARKKPAFKVYKTKPHKAWDLYDAARNLQQAKDMATSLASYGDRVLVHQLKAGSPDYKSGFRYHIYVMMMRR